MFREKHKKEYEVFTLRNFKKNTQVRKFLSKKQQHAIEVVGNVLPFKVNNYVIDELIDWSNIPEDPIFQLTFPQLKMLSKNHFIEMEKALSKHLSISELKIIANKIRYELNLHPAAQKHNVPMLNGKKLSGVQHKYRETALFFPSDSQTCHAYCTFCFRWSQFVGIKELKFAMREIELLVKYLNHHPEISDVLFTGGDPMIMSAKKFAAYVEPLINQRVPSLQTIRIGTKSLGYWPYKFLTNEDADDMLRIFAKIVNQGYHLAIMAHFNHPRELETKASKHAIKRILDTGAIIRTQSPVLKHVNNDAGIWKKMWSEQVRLGCVPYYMFVGRDTGSQGYFAVELEKTWEIFKKAYRQVSGIARTVRGPSMSVHQGKIQIAGVCKIKGQKVFCLQFIQGRNPGWVGKPFFAAYNANAIWFDDLVPAFGQKNFFFEEKLPNKMLN